MCLPCKSCTRPVRLSPRPSLPRTASAESCPSPQKSRRRLACTRLRAPGWSQSSRFPPRTAAAPTRPEDSRSRCRTARTPSRPHGAGRCPLNTCGTLPALQLRRLCPERTPSAPRCPWPR
eukprot:7375807-Prymnesium_polylepis.1